MSWLNFGKQQQQERPSLPKATTVRRRQMMVTLFVFAGLVGIVVFGMWLSDPRRKAEFMEKQAARKDVTVDYTVPAQKLDPRDIWLTMSRDELADLKKQVADLHEQLANSSGTNVAPPSSTKPAQPIVPPQETLPLPPGAQTTVAPAPTNSSVMRRTSLPAPSSSRTRNGTTAPSGNTTSNGVTVDQPHIFELTLGTAGTATAAPAKGATVEKAHTVRDWLPAGTFVEVKLLSGVDAPTGTQAKTNPHPALFDVVDMAFLPNQFRTQIKNCRAITAAYGDRSAQRAYFRTETLSCVSYDGRVLETPIKGYIVGEDSSNGMRGKVVNKQGEVLGNALIAGIAGGLGSGLTQSFSRVSTSALGSVQTVDPSQIAQYGLAQGSASALNKLADFYIAQAEEMFPVVEILPSPARTNGKWPALVLTEGASLGENFQLAEIDE